MSRLSTNNVAAGIALLAAVDDRVQPPWYSFLPSSEPEEIQWPRSRMCSGGLTVAEAPLNNAAQIWDWLPFMAASAAAGQRRNTNTGFVRTAMGVVVSGATVTLYRTVNDEVLDKTTSASDGSYTLTSPYGSEATYEVSYKTGSPDTAGTTVNTLTPA